MNAVFRFYSLILSTKVGHTREKDSGFVQTLQGAVIIIFIKAAALV